MTTESYSIAKNLSTIIDQRNDQFTFFVHITPVVILLDRGHSIHKLAYLFIFKIHNNLSFRIYSPTLTISFHGPNPIAIKSNLIPYWFYYK